MRKQNTKKSKKKTTRGRPKKKQSSYQPVEVEIPDDVVRVECSWKPIIKSFGSEERKCGRYHGSSFYNVKGYGKTRWPVAGYLLTDYEKCFEEGMTEEEIISACLAYLNTPPPRKKYTKKKPTPEYGFLEPIQAKFKKNGDEQYIEIIVSTNECKNKNFWNEGRVL